MKRKKLNMAQYGMLAPNVQRGGQAIPIGNNLYLMKGRQHSAGGIDIGKDLEVENNEVMQMLPNETRVFSSMPMLGGYSPAQLVTNGNNPDLVFNAQERWKKENRVRDDGSTYKEGGIHINPANKGKFTAQAKQHGMGVQSFANKVLAHKENYSPTTVKRATFAKYIGGRKPFGGISRLAKLGKRIKGAANDGSRDIYYDYDKKRWVFGLNRTVLPYGHKVRLSDGEEYQLNSDGTMTRKFKVNIYNDTKNGQVLDKKDTIARRSMDVEDARATVNYKNRILYDKNREMVLTSKDPRFRAQNVHISESLLDTLADAAKRASLPFSTVAGLAYRESTLGANLTDEYRDPYYKAGYVTPGDLFTINSYMQDNPYRELMNNYKGNEKDFDAAFNRTEQKMEKFNVDENPIDYALRQFKEGNYNRGDKNYYNKVANDIQILLTSPQIREYMTRHNLKKAGGQLVSSNVYGIKTKNMNLQNIYGNSLARFGKRINGSIVRMDGSGIDKLAYIPITGNRPKTLKAGGRRMAEEGISYYDVNMPVRKRKYSTVNIDDLLEERMKYVEPYFKGQSDIPGYINAGANALGSIATSLITNNAINKQRPPVKPMPLIAPKLKTNFNINADLDANREATRQVINEVKRNTASSHVGKNLINQQLFAKALADSKLYTDKENNETALINKDITQRAEIANKNIEKGNAYRQALADFYSNKALAKGQNWAQMVNGLGQAIGMGLNNIGATNTKKLNALIAMLPAIETFKKNKKS